MPDPSPGAGHHPLSRRVGSTTHLELRLLWHHFGVSTDSRDVEHMLAFLVQEAVQHVEVRHTVAIDIRTTDDGFAITEDGTSLPPSPDALGVLDTVYQRVHQHMFDEASRTGWVRAHAALVEVDGRRCLICAGPGVGKTTLAVRMLFDGATVHGDESVLVRHGEVLAVPRLFHLKPGIEVFVPEVEPFLAQLPRLDDDSPVRAFDPILAGRRWDISPGSVDVVVVLERGLRTELEPVAATTAMQDIVEQVFLLYEPKGVVVREIATLLRTTPSFRLCCADPREAAAAIRELAATVPTRG